VASAWPSGWNNNPSNSADVSDTQHASLTARPRISAMPRLASDSPCRVERGGTPGPADGGRRMLMALLVTLGVDLVFVAAVLSCMRWVSHQPLAIRGRDAGRRWWVDGLGAKWRPG